MCRFTAYLGPAITMDTLVTLPSHSLIHQSYKAEEREEPLNGDGFGVAWYVPDVGLAPGLFRSISPAWNSRNLACLAGVTRSPCILAHVRAATPGLGVAESNCHPFTWGRLSFMHNGVLAGFQQIRRTLLSELSQEAFDDLEGTTDSEHVFAVFRDRYEASNEEDELTRMRTALLAAVEHVVELTGAASGNEPSMLNLLVTNGETMVATRFTTGAPERANSLYMHAGKRYACKGGACVMLEPDAEGSSVLIASERLGTDPGWGRVPPNHVVSIREDRTTEVSRMQ